MILFRRETPARRGRWHPSRRRPVALAVVLVGAFLAAPACAAADDRPVEPGAAPCPERLAGKAACFSGQDENGAFVTMAVPNQWNRSLVVHSHGGPEVSAEASGPVEDLEEWAVLVEQGYAWVGSSYRRGGYGIRMAAEDTETARRLFVDQVDEPDRTYLHGQSYGGNVAAKLAETEAGRSGSYDGMLLTSGNVAGGSRAYDHRVDLRAVYQYYCENLPRPSEPRYPLWQGLPADSTLTPEDVVGRLEECTGLSAPREERTTEQQGDLDDILAVTRLTEESLETNLLYSTFLFQDMTSKRLGGRNPFGNEHVRYSGSRDDAALNAGVERFAADPSAYRDLSYDSDLTGQISMPVLSLHAIGDPSVFVEHEAAYRDSVAAAGRSDQLVQTFTTEAEHNELSDSEYAASITALDAWVRSGDKPTPQSIAESCVDLDRAYGTGCFYDPAFEPEALTTRVNPRGDDITWPAMDASLEREWAGIDGVGIAP